MLELIVCLFFAWGIFFAYYVHVYLWKRNPENLELHQRDPNSVEPELTLFLIMLRIYTLIAACLYVAFYREKDASIISTLKLQINFEAIISLIQTFLLNSLLFGGPLLQYYLFNQFGELKEKLIPNGWLLFKKVYATACLEEMVFRVIIFGILAQNGYSNSEINWITSLLFSISHAHNLVHVYKVLGFKKGLFQTLFQMMFTFIFAFYCGRITMRTHSYYSAALLHSYCNLLGFPNIGQLFPLNLKDRKTQVILGGYIFGIIGFFKLI